MPEDITEICEAHVTTAPGAYGRLVQQDEYGHVYVNSFEELCKIMVLTHIVGVYRIDQLFGEVFKYVTFPTAIYSTHMTSQHSTYQKFYICPKGCAFQFLFNTSSQVLRLSIHYIYPRNNPGRMTAVAETRALDNPAMIKNAVEIVNYIQGLYPEFDYPSQMSLVSKYISTGLEKYRNQISILGSRARTSE